MSTPEPAPKPKPVAFSPAQPKHRKSGISGIYQLNDHLWKGKYSPQDASGKRISRNVYAPTRKECEEKLMVMIEVANGFPAMSTHQPERNARKN